MTKTIDDSQDSSDIEPRTRRALSECMSVLTPDFQPITDDSLTVVTVTTGSGSTYTVDVREGVCTCPDHKHRNATCKHLRRARVSLAHDSVDSETLARLDIDAGLGANAPGPVVTTSDGGVVGGDGAELVDDSDSPRWIGPHTEYNQYGEPTGAHYLVCSSCGVQVLSGRQKTAYHTPECARRSGE